MKNLPLILSSLSFVGVIVLLALHFSPSKTNTNTNTTLAAATIPTNGLKIAYVNIDTLEAHYDYLKAKKEDFKRKQSQMESELQRSAQQMQSDYEEIQKKAQSNSMTQTEMETAQKRLGQMQQSLEARKQSMTETLMKEQDDFNKDLKMRLDAVMDTYNKDKHFDYIFSYSSSGSSLLYVNKQWDITKDIIDAVNIYSKK